jgi:putative ABC transport system substrate-binding protein
MPDYLSRVSKLYCWFAVALILVPAIAPSNQPQDPAKTYRVGVLTLLLADRPHITGLREGLRMAGYTEGKNLSLAIPARKSPHSIRTAAITYVSEKTNVIVATGNSETKIAAELTREIPIVFLPASDPVGFGFVQSFARPGKNLTGITYYAHFREVGKQIEIFKEISPALRRAVLLTDAGSEALNDFASTGAIRETARHLGVVLREIPVTKLEQAERFVATLSSQSVDGILIACSSLFWSLEKIGALARQKLIPLYGCSSSQVIEDGALFSYAPDMYQLGRRGAWYVDRILKGANPADLPVETPRAFRFVINLKTAQVIGLKIPPEVLQRADKVVK